MIKAGEQFKPQVGDHFWEWINQAYRGCEVLKVTKTRIRIAYSTADNDFQAWRHLTGGGFYTAPGKQ